MLSTFREWEAVFQNYSPYRKHILLYYSIDGRQLQHLYSGETYATSLHGIKFVFHDGLHEEQQGHPEQVENSDTSHQKRPFSDSDNEGYDTHRRTKRRAATVSIVEDNKLATEIETFLLQHPVSPLQNSCKTVYWLGSKYRFRGISDKVYMQVLTAIRAKLSHWSIQDYVKFYTGCKPWFQCLNGNLSDYYLSLDDSVYQIRKLIQCHMRDIWACDNISDEEGELDFWTTLYNLLDRNHGKINCLEIIGPASCAKSYFCNFICDFFLAVGHIENFTRQNNFPLQSAYNQRILHWNEAQCEPAKLEDAKKILGGDPCAANIKYQDIQVINKTPVIITANK